MDISNAFGAVDHDLILDILAARGLPAEFCKHIADTYTKGDLIYIMEGKEAYSRTLSSQTRLPAKPRLVQSLLSGTTEITLLIQRVQIRKLEKDSFSWLCGRHLSTWIVYPVSV